MIEEAEQVGAQNEGVLTSEQRTKLQQAYDFIAQKFPWLAHKAINVLAVGTLALGFGGVGIASAQEAGSAGVNGDTAEQAGVEVAQALPTEGITSEETTVFSSLGSDQVELATLNTGTNVSILGTDSGSTPTYFLIEYIDQDGQSQQGWVLRAHVTALRLTENLNVTAPAENPATITFQTESGPVTATLVPREEAAPTPPPSEVTAVYATPEGKIYGRTIGDGDLPKFEFRNGKWEHVESSRMIYEQFLPGGNSEILLQRYPDLRWDSEYGMYRFSDGRFFAEGLGDKDENGNVTIDGDYADSDLENGPQKLLFEFSSNNVPLTLRVFISDHHERVANMTPSLDEDRIDRILGYYLALEPQLQGKILSITIPPSGDYANVYGPNAGRLIFGGAGEQIVVFSKQEPGHFAGGLTPQGQIWHGRLWINSDIIDIQRGPENFAYEVFSGVIGLLRNRQNPGVAQPIQASTLLFKDVFDADFYSEMVPLFGVEEYR